MGAWQDANSGTMGRFSYTLSDKNQRCVKNPTPGISMC
jgi:hypothetical protein